MSFEKTSAPNPDDTIVAVSSAPGPAPRAIVRVGGPNARGVVGAVFTEDAPTTENVKMGRVSTWKLLQEGRENRSFQRYFARGTLRLTGVHSPLPATLYFFAGPRSYTGQDIAELHKIGSPPLVERLVVDLLAAGARPARPGEFTMRAFLAGKKDLPQAEAVQAVIEAGTDADLSAALTQLAGGVSRPLEVLRDDLLNLLADVEAALDFADEDIEFVGKADTLHRVESAIRHLEAVQRQLDDRTVSGRPVRVALVGLPNAGKSSLFNLLAGGSALVSAIPGTTRDYLTKSLTLAGVSVELIDTAGWQAATDTIEEQAQRLGSEQTTRADVIVWCDERGAFAEADEQRLTATGAAVLKVWTKSDLSLTSPLEGEVGEASAGLSSLPTGPAGSTGARWGGSVLVERGLAPPRKPHDSNESLSGSPPTRRPKAAGDLPLQGGGQRQAVLASSVVSPNGLAALRGALSDTVTSLTRPALAPSQSRCRHHVLVCLDRLREARALAANDDPPELLALALRGAIDALGEMTGAVYTNDLLDRIFSRFCIGK